MNSDKRKIRIVKRIVRYSEFINKSDLEELSEKDLIKLQKQFLIPLIVKVKYRSRMSKK